MWLSRMMYKSKGTLAETGMVTIGGNEPETTATIQSRKTVSFSPYGYSFSVPVGEEMLLLDSGAGLVGAGTKMTSKNLKNGEVSISSFGGAKIELKDDGSVKINGLVINANGEIEE